MIRFWVFNRLQATVFAIGALWGFSRLLDISVRPSDWLLVPLLATCVYQLNRLSDFEEDRINHPEDARSAKRNRQLIWTAVMVSLAGTLVLSFVHFTIPGLIMVISLLGLGYLYSIPTRWKDGKRRLKDIFIGKNLAPAFGWAMIVCLYPAVNAGSKANFEIIACFLAVLVGSFLLEIICDVRDYEGDKVEDIQTFPVRFGLARTKRITNLLNTLAGLTILFAIVFDLLALPWTLFFINNVLVAVMLNFKYDQLASNRLLSHSLIFYQILLVIGLGMLA